MKGNARKKRKHVVMLIRGHGIRDPEPGRHLTGLGRGVGLFQGMQLRRTQLALELGTTLDDLRAQVNALRIRERQVRRHFLRPSDYPLGQTELRVKWCILDRMLVALGK